MANSWKRVICALNKGGGPITPYHAKDKYVITFPAGAALQNGDWIALGTTPIGSPIIAVFKRADSDAPTPSGAAYDTARQTPFFDDSLVILADVTDVDAPNDVALNFIGGLIIGGSWSFQIIGSALEGYYTVTLPGDGTVVLEALSAGLAGQPVTGNVDSTTSGSILVTRKVIGA